MVPILAVLIISLPSVAMAQPDPEHAAPATTAEQAPAKPAPPEGLTKNMIYLEFVTVAGSFKDWFEGEVTVLTDGRNKYCVYDFPSKRYATDEAVPKVILVPGRILEMLGNRRAYRWFSDGTVTPKMIADYNTKSGHLDYPLGD